MDLLQGESLLLIRVVHDRVIYLLCNQSLLLMCGRMGDVLLGGRPWHVMHADDPNYAEDEPHCRYKIKHHVLLSRKTAPSVQFYIIYSSFEAGLSMGEDQPNSLEFV